MKRFSGGDFTAPAFIDTGRKPGMESLKPFAGQITFEVEELPAGGKLRIEATGPDAIAAVQSLLRAQQHSDHP